MESTEDPCHGWENIGRYQSNWEVKLKYDDLKVRTTLACTECGEEYQMEFFTPFGSDDESQSREFLESHDGFDQYKHTRFVNAGENIQIEKNGSTYESVTVTLTADNGDTFTARVEPHNFFS